MTASFKCPTQKLILQVSDFNDEKKKQFKSAILDHYFNYSVSVIVPGSVTKRQMQEAMETVTDQQYFTVHDLPLSKLIDVEFIEAFVKRGNMYMLSCDTHIDTSDICIALHPPGRLLLNVNKEMYILLGLEGKPSQFNGKKSSRYVVTVDLTQPHFHPEKKNYKRVKWCFTDRLKLTFNFLVAWVPFDNDICSSSIGAYFTSCGFKSTPGVYKKSNRKLNELVVPQVDASCSETVDSSDCDHSEFFEWLGAVTCDCDFGESDGYVSTYFCPEPNTIVADGVLVYKLFGFCSPESILQLLDKLRDLVKVQHLPWISFTVHGFADSPVSWSCHEHGYHDNGDNLYTFVLFANNSYWHFTATGTKDSIS